jgi:hypothetical protein
MTTHKKFYFLHIPKTGGRYVKSYILDQIKNKVEVIDKQERHSGWIEDIDENTYVFSILRDPVKMICSQYAHLVSQKAGLIEDSLDMDQHTDHIKQNIVNINLDKHHFLKWIYANPWMYNLQSKEILNGSTENKNVMDVIVQKHTFTKNVDKDLLYERLNRINLLVRQVSLYNPESLAQKICNDLNIDLAGEIEKDTSTYHNMASSNLYNSLTEEEISWIEDLFAVDVEIYNNHSIFSQLDNVCSFCGRYAYTTEFDSTWKKYSFCVECIKSKEALIG